MANKNKKRNEVRVLDIPDKLFKRITDAAAKEKRSIGKEILLHLEKTY